MDTEAGGARIRVGLVSSEAAPRRGTLAREHLDGFCAALAGALGAQVTAREFPNYRDLLDAMHAGLVHLAWLPPVVAVRATARGRTVPIALPVRDGDAYYSTALFTRPDSRIKGLGDLAGTAAAWVDRQSAAGYIVIRASLRQRGVDVDHVFASETFHGSHAAVVQAVLGGGADVGASFVHLDPRRSKPRRAGWGDALVRMIATAGPIPGDVIAATIRMPVSAIRTIQQALLSPPTDEFRRAAAALFQAEGFVEASSEHLDPISQLLGQIDDR